MDHELVKNPILDGSNFKHVSGLYQGAGCKWGKYNLENTGSTTHLALLIQNSDLLLLTIRLHKSHYLNCHMAKFQTKISTFNFFFFYSAGV
jgi:hypothetical protein